MAPMALTLILGWCLVAANRAQQLPRPSLSLHPSQGVSLGNNVTLRCHLPQPAAWVQLSEDEAMTICRSKLEVQDTAEFSIISAERKHATTYRCLYWVLGPLGTSEQSDPVELVVTDHSLPPPGISLSPEERVQIGTNVTIRCWNQDSGVIFLLHKDGCSAPIQRQDSDGLGMASFTLFQVTASDAGTYRCSYRPKDDPLVSSPLGDSVTLEVTPTPAPPGADGGSHGNLVVPVVRCCVAALIFIVGLLFILDARSLQIQRDQAQVGKGFQIFYPLEIPQTAPSLPVIPNRPPENPA
ncbi:T-cell-interacting, activating receptor on myeloid cells protein 1-like isoform X4 [Numida meleagris]|uniref:T-cell-interacting, activating receptor on myeloid cells protein 1-like isoform X4 n=1 Tax=Numida meleagris TaxID=8996 RepID=UPI000B3DB659|nr:T-cell-interacting, activating receptor on myeloid cells protein 1-like isoform X4 [Numida meleagris]